MTQRHDPLFLEQLYRALYLIRRVEERIIEIYPSDRIKSPVHLSIGQEAVAVGVSAALRPADVVFGTYRGHAMYLAKGGDLGAMIAELYGKQTGCAKGKGGSMHLIDTAARVMGTSAIVGTTIPVSVGYAYALKITRSDTAVVSFFGDGAVDEGAFHESLNFAALHRLPVLFVCENNLYAIHSHHLKRHHSDNITERARTYGMQAARLEDGDIFAIHELTRQALADVRAGKGPFFMECVTCRWKEHVGPNDDFDLGYRSTEEVACARKNDQITYVASLLLPAQRATIERQINDRIEAAIAAAEAAPFPDPSELTTDVYGD